MSKFFDMISFLKGPKAISTVLSMTMTNCDTKFDENEGTLKEIFTRRIRSKVKKRTAKLRAELITNNESVPKSVSKRL